MRRLQRILLLLLLLCHRRRIRRRIRRRGRGRGSSRHSHRRRSRCCSCCCCGGGGGGRDLEQRKVADRHGGVNVLRPCRERPRVRDPGPPKVEQRRRGLRIHQARGHARRVERNAQVVEQNVTRSLQNQLEGEAAGWGPR